MSSVPAPTCDHCQRTCDEMSINGVTGRHCADCWPHRSLPAELAWAALGWWLSRRIDRAFAAAGRWTA